MPNLSLRERRLRARSIGARDRKAFASRRFLGIGNRATLTTAMAGANNDLFLFAAAPGTAGNSITLTIAVAGNNTPLSVSVAGSAITVNSATDGAGLPTSTAIQVVYAILNYIPAAALVWAQTALANDGTGIVAAMGPSSLAGAI